MRIRTACLKLHFDGEAKMTLMAPIDGSLPLWDKAITEDPSRLAHDETLSRYGDPSVSVVAFSSDISYCDASLTVMRLIFSLRSAIKRLGIKNHPCDQHSDCFSHAEGHEQSRELGQDHSAYI